MTGSELIALSLGLSVGVAALGGVAAAALDRVSGDAGLRERAWTAALWLPALPPLAVAALLLTPAPVRTVAAAPMTVVETLAPQVASVALPAAAPGLTLDGAMAATLILILAGLMIGARLASLAWRARRLNRLIARTVPASPEAEASVAVAARSLGVATPAVRACATGSDALLAGLVRPLLILPQALARHPEASAARAVITHELAHLKRGDHRAVWLEEGLLTLLAVNPLLPSIRARRAAAREEACDALALTGAEDDARRAYAQSLIEALRARTDTTPMPALTFTGIHRSQAMRRLKSILTPPAAAGRGTKIAAVLAGVSLLAVTGFAAAAVAGQRETVVLIDPRDATSQSQSAAIQATEAAFAALPSEKRALYRDVTAAQYRTLCASGDETDGGFCAGVLFAALPGTDDASESICAPRLANGAADTAAVASLGRQAVAAVAVRQGQEPVDVARTALQRAFPCPAALAKTVDLGAATAMTINGAPVPATLPFWALAATNVEVRSAKAAGGPAIDFVVPVSASPPVYVDGMRLPRGVGLTALKTDVIARAEPRADGSIHVQLKPRPATPALVAATTPSDRDERVQAVERLEPGAAPAAAIPLTRLAPLADPAARAAAAPTELATADSVVQQARSAAARAAIRAAAQEPPLPLQPRVTGATDLSRYTTRPRPLSGRGPVR